MPKDGWAKARSKDIGKQVRAKSAASTEYRSTGMEYVKTKAKKIKKSETPPGYGWCKYCKTLIWLSRLEKSTKRSDVQNGRASGE